MSLICFDDDYVFWRLFSFQKFWRNEKKIHKISGLIKKTGTTICAIVYNDGVILASDSRSTNGEISCDNNCEKIHYLAPNIFCCGAGTSADTENITRLVSHQLELHRISTGRETRVNTSISLCQKILFQHHGFLSAALIIGGFDSLGSHLFSIHPHGSSEKLSFVAMGSGSLAAIALLENLYFDNLKIDKAILIIQEAIMAGIYNDIGSGGCIDLCIITEENVKIFRNKIHNNVNFLKFNFFHNNFVFPKI